MRDNLAFSLEDKAQRKLNFAIVDEVDSILIDEARTPLIISGPAEASTDLYAQINKLVPKLEEHNETEEPTNYDIFVKNVRLKDLRGMPVTTTGENGEQSDVLSLDAAIDIGDEQQADVVLVDDSEKIGVCKLVKRGRLHEG